MIVYISYFTVSNIFIQIMFFIEKLLAMVSSVNGP